ncbi:MAG: sugar phosphate isomerase/epimerase [Bacteroidales bacterium]|jgi:sugar phosphate isomerase/epimerase|nr:sugar phosphate isomerase/epimerase [Bacteroidales bacterium]
MKNLSRREFIKKSTIGGVVLASGTGALVNACSSSKWKIGAYTRVWGNRNYLEALDGMVEAGYKYVGLSTHEKGRVVDRNSDPEFAVQVGEEIKKRGLTLVTNSGGEHDVSNSLEEGIAGLKRLIDNSALCGAPVIQINAIHDPVRMEPFYKAISECCDYAAEKGVLITLKPHGQVGAFCLEQVKKVNHKNFKLWYDPGNVFHASFGETDPLDDAVGLGGYVVGMAVKDFRLPRDVNVTPGTGMVDFPKLLALLGQEGFTSGALVVELVSQGDLAHLTAEAIKARKFLESITA